MGEACAIIGAAAAGMGAAAAEAAAGVPHLLQNAPVT
jgi:hypothetical protein